MIMLILDSPSSDPRFNIAAEEYLLKNSDRQYAFFYINDPCIIIGKHQNAWAEINIPWTMRNDIPVIRRLSGGGTVFQDPGNLNFSFILNGEEGKLVNFRQYAAPVLEFIVSLGLPVEFGKRNEMIVSGLKISGNAEHIHRKRVLHHGTLLFSSDLSRLKNALDTNPGLYEDKAVQSIRSRVGNILDFLDSPMDIASFRQQLLDHILSFYHGSERITFRDDDILGIEALVEEKYSLWSWNIGYSPRYKLTRDIDLGDIPVHAELDVEKGMIINCRLSITGRHPGKSTEDSAADLKLLSETLLGTTHDPAALHQIISSKNLVKPEWIDIFVQGFF